MSEPETEEQDMDAKTEQDIKARLDAACDTDVNAAPTLRQRLANGSRSALAERLAKALPGI